MKNILLLSALLIFALSCSKDEDSVPLKGSNYSSSSLLDTLTKGYTNSTQAELIWFLDTWNQEYTSNEDSINLSGGIAKDIYSIFKLIYKPFDINELGEHEWVNIYTDESYVVIQNIIYFNFNYDNTDNYTYDSICNFRPDAKFNNVRNLYYTPKYSEIIYDFLSHGEKFEMMKGYDEETIQRATYLNNGITIFPGHWGGIWHILTHPEVSGIYFNTNKTKARAYFRVVYMFGIADFEKQDGTWKMTSSSINGIE